MRPLVSLLLSTLQIFLFLITKSYSQDSSLITICSGGNYNSSTPYPSNLHSLITRITAAAPKSQNLYSTDAVGNSSSEVFGLAQCRPDASAASCAACLNRAAGAALGGICGRNKSASVRYDYCLLRYSEQRFFSIPKQRPVEVRYNTENASQPMVFAAQVERLLQQVSLAAAVAESRFAVNSSELRDVYVMAWCTMDLLSNDCLQCLYGGMALLPKMMVGAQAESVSCAVRFENYMFFEEPFIAVPPIPSSFSGGAGGDNSTSAGRMQNNKNTTRIVIGGAAGAVALLFLCAMIILLITRKMKKIKLRTCKRRGDEDISSAATLMLDLATIRSATNNFSEFNKLGEGGFGPVYKGVLRNGQEIAVKRLAKASGQGLTEMRNEVVFVAKLQHKNLVRLVGCCLEENEKLLVYEYLPNTSLDKLLFDPTGRESLDWATRYKIIEGICRGLLYLHEDSRFRIIHRDLKASNILLGANMEPKISDFGLAKLSGIYETHCNTSRISGTYGYMSPEYAFHGLFSTKSDVFSYGVLVLEIVTGQSSSCFLASRSNLDFLSYVWQYWNQGMALQLVDRSLGDRYPPEQALRCIQIGLLCVQEDPAERPSMSTLVVMLSHHSVLVPVPSMPQFLQRLQVFVAHSSETDMPRSDYSNRHGDITTSDCLSSSSGSIRLLSPASPLAN